jgi:hypothetical protein
MTNAPALIVHYRRFTLVIALLLACQLVIAAVGISIELHKTQAGVALMLSPQILVLFAAYLAKTACDRWATSAVCLTVSAEGLMLPGLTQRPIPWTAVKSVRGICCSPAPEQAATPRHYVLFDVEAPESFGVARRGAVQHLTSPLPSGAPPLAIDLSELDAGKEAIVEAVRRFRPEAVVDADPERPGALAAGANDASLRFPSPQELRLGFGRMRADVARGFGRRDEVLPAVVDAWRRSEPRLRAGAQTLIAAAVEMQRSSVASARDLSLSLKDLTAATVATGMENLRSVGRGIMGWRGLQDWMERGDRRAGG